MQRLGGGARRDGPLLSAREKSLFQKLQLWAKNSESVIRAKGSNVSLVTEDAGGLSAFKWKIGMRKEAFRKLGRI